MHVTLLEPAFDAVTVTVLPVVALETLIVGVASRVLLSVDDDPSSESASRSGVDGATMALTVIDIVDVVF